MGQTREKMTTDRDHADKTWLQPSEQPQTDFVHLLDLAGIILAATLGAAFGIIAVYWGAL